MIVPLLICSNIALLVIALIQGASLDLAHRRIARTLDLMSTLTKAVRQLYDGQDKPADGINQ